MFCLSERTSPNKIIEEKNKFGWWIGETEMLISCPYSKKLESSNSSSYFESNKREDCILSHESTLNLNIGDENNEGKAELIELNSLKKNVDLDQIADQENKLIENGFRISPHGISYSPERLVKSEEYKIFSPPVQTVCIHSSRSRQRKLKELIDSKRVGANHLEALLCPSISEVRDSYSFDSRRSRNKNEMENHQIVDTGLSSRISRYEKQNGICLKETSGSHKISSSKEDQSTGWNLDTLNDSRAPFRLNESTNFILSGLENQTQETNSMEEEGLFLGSLEINHNREDFFELRTKVERLRAVNENMQKDISTLKEDFQTDEWKVNTLLEDTNNFRKDIQDLKYLDDLLNLLRGEVERISQKKWPFISGNVDLYTEEINLII